MKSFLEQVLDAHGGLQRWTALRTARATLVTGGELWAMKGLVQDASPRQMSVLLHSQWASVTPYGAADRKTAFTPGRIAIETLDGELVAERLEPRDSFAGHQMETPWDPLHRAYFNGYALWTYLTTPFLLAMPGVRVEEVEPWYEGTEKWRRLRVHFPQAIATHSEVQDFFFDTECLLRRHDYRVEVAGGFNAAQYVGDYIEADGIRLPTTRRAYRRGADDAPLRDRLLVAIDLSAIHFN
ncbi:MAG: hypothetical protein V4812_18165 [Pseudomonadota bacterium]